MATIRLAQLEDAEYIYQLNRYALGYAYEIEATKARLASVLGKDTDRIWVAVEDNRVVGYIHSADYECLYMDPLKNIMALAVEEAYRGRGIGKQLLFTAEKWAKESGCSGVRFTSGYEREKAHEFYLHCQYIHRKNAKSFIKQFPQMYAKG